MNWFTDRHCFLVAVVVYGLSVVYSVFLWRKGFRQDNRVNYILLLLAFAFHTLAMIQRGLPLDRCPVNNLYEATTFIAWTIVTSYLVFGFWTRLRFLGAFASPVLFGLGVFALMPGLDEHGPTPQFTGGLFSLHVALFALAYGAIGLGAVAGLMYLTQEHDLKFHKLRAILSVLPSIQRLELVTWLLLLAGFFLMTSGLIISALWFKQEAGVYFSSDPKILWSVLVWLLCLSLVVMRWTFEQGGRRLAWGTIGVFIFVLLTFWGSSMWSPIHRP